MREAARLTAPRGPVDTQASPHARWRTLALDDVGLDPATFWAQRQAPIRSRGLRHGFRMLQEWGNLDNLRLAAGTLEGAYRGPVFMDSDVYKWLEAVAYFVPLDADLRAVADEAIERGPMVYCFEQADHADADVLDIALDATALLEARWQSDLLDGVSGVQAYGFVNAQPDALYIPSDGSVSPRRTTPLRAVPYYAWSNRAPGAMRVWTPIV
jgi:DUF1680 family protein